jgi:hypothetical protein
LRIGDIKQDEFVGALFDFRSWKIGDINEKFVNSKCSDFSDLKIERQKK